MKSHSISITKNLAKSASQKLQGLVVEYPVLCCELGGGEVFTPESLSSEPSTPQEQQQPQVDQKGLMNIINQTFRAVPQHVMDRMPDMFSDRKKDQPKPASNDEDNSSLLSSLSAYISPESKTAQVKAEPKVLAKKLTSKTDDSAEIRSKYMAKLAAVKKRATQRADEEALAANSPSKNLPKWRVNDGARGFLHYVDLRGLSLSVVPPLAPERQAEFDEFYEQMKSSIDQVMPLNEAQTQPLTRPLVSLCDRLQLEPKQVMAIGISNDFIKAANEAGCLVCRYNPEKKYLGSARAHHTLSHLDNFRDLVESINGISFRDLRSRFS